MIQQMIYKGTASGFKTVAVSGGLDNMGLLRRMEMLCRAPGTVWAKQASPCPIFSRCEVNGGIALGLTVKDPDDDRNRSMSHLLYVPHEDCGQLLQKGVTPDRFRTAYLPAKEGSSLPELEPGAVLTPVAVRGMQSGAMELFSDANVLAQFITMLQMCGMPVEKRGFSGVCVRLPKLEAVQSHAAYLLMEGLLRVYNGAGLMPVGYRTLWMAPENNVQYPIFFTSPDYMPATDMLGKLRYILVDVAGAKVQLPKQMAITPLEEDMKFAQALLSGDLNSANAAMTDIYAAKKRRAEQIRLERERQERERQEAIRREQERLERERLEQERAAEERRRQAMLIEQQRQEQLRLERERVERERLERERQERERQEAIRLEREKREFERQEAIRLEQERKEKERLERERFAEAQRLEREKREFERQEAIRLEREKREQERQEKLRLEQERKEKERLERERIAEERRQQAIRLEQERQEKERLEREKREQERKEQQRLEQERKEQQKRQAEALHREASKVAAATRAQSVNSQLERDAQRMRSADQNLQRQRAQVRESVLDEFRRIVNPTRVANNKAVSLEKEVDEYLISKARAVGGSDLAKMDCASELIDAINRALREDQSMASNLYYTLARCAFIAADAVSRILFEHAYDYQAEKCMKALEKVYNCIKREGSPAAQMVGSPRCLKWEIRIQIFYNEREKDSLMDGVRMLNKLYGHGDAHLRSFQRELHRNVIDMIASAKGEHKADMLDYASLAFFYAGIEIKPDRRFAPPSAESIPAQIADVLKTIGGTRDFKENLVELLKNIRS